MPDPLTVKAVTEAATFAAAQTDRWLFIALLLVFLGAIWLMARWFMERDKAMQSRADNQQAIYEAKLEAMQARVDAQANAFNTFLQDRHASMAAIVEKNTAVLEKSVATLESAASLLKIATDNLERKRLQ